MKFHAFVPVVAVMLGVFFACSTLQAYERYNPGCSNCHGSFLSSSSIKPGNTWPDNKHNVHRSDMLDNECDACHSQGDGDNPFINMSDGTPDLPGIGCIGCHGRFYEGGLGYSGAGLQKHHASAGVTVCGMCHDEVRTLPENGLPPYYGQPGVNVFESCNGDGSENWTSDGEGLDNDGDLAYDQDDPNCTAPPHWSAPVQSF